MKEYIVMCYANNQCYWVSAASPRDAVEKSIKDMDGEWDSIYYAVVETAATKTFDVRHGITEIGAAEDAREKDRS